MQDLVVRRTDHAGAGHVLVQHLDRGCLADPEALTPRSVVGGVLCECGSWGWLD